MKEKSLSKLNLALVFVVAFLVVFLFIAGFKPDLFQMKSITSNSNKGGKATEEPLNNVLPEKGVSLPIKWGNLSREMIDKGVIDSGKFKNLYVSQGDFEGEVKNLIESADPGEITININNANVLLNLLWAFALANNNPILTQGAMSDPAYGGAQSFASTGGWNLAASDTMDHYSKHEFVKLSDDEQEVVEQVAKNIYRPCCDNPTDFPDCNHGMAMLGLIELMAKNKVSEQEMYRVALQVNSYWFPGYYPVIAKYLKTQGIAWEDADPQTVLGYKYSSASGFRQIKSIVEPSSNSSSSKCST